MTVAILYSFAMEDLQYSAVENIDQPFIFRLIERDPAVTASDVGGDEGILVAAPQNTGDRQPVVLPENEDFNSVL
jgi:hypothetical protein